MLQDIFLTPEEIALKQEVRAFVKREVSSDLIRRMDRDEITYPREFVKALGERKLLGLRFPKKYGGRGHGLGRRDRGPRRGRRLGNGARLRLLDALDRRRGAPLLRD